MPGLSAASQQLKPSAELSEYNFHAEESWVSAKLHSDPHITDYDPEKTAWFNLGIAICMCTCVCSCVSMFVCMCTYVCMSRINLVKQERRRKGFSVLHRRRKCTGTKLADS